MSENHSEESETEINEDAFKFDRVFQEKIAHAMVIDHPWAAQFNEVLEISNFQYAYLQFVVSKYIGYYKEYKEFPSIDLLLTIVKADLKGQNDEMFIDQIKSFFSRVLGNKDLGDLGYVKDQSLNWCKKRALMKALSQSITFAERAENHEKIIDVLKKAITAGSAQTEGLDLMEDIDARYSETYRKTVPTGIMELDQKIILNGGLGAGELGIVVAPTGVGKSHWLVQCGSAAVRNGKNVIHYTFELNERMTGIRYDSNLLDIPSLNCYDKKDEIKKFYKENADDLGKLRIKYMATSNASVMALRSHVEKLAATGFRPDLICVDYAGIMRSSERYELLRLELKKVCEELRLFADELQVPVWTALQSNKEGASAEVVDLTNMAESYGQAHVADFVVGLSRPSSQKSTGYGTLFVAKNRAGRDGIQYKIHLDTGKSKVRVLNESEIGEMAESIKAGRLSQQEQALDYMRKKYRDKNKQ